MPVALSDPTDGFNFPPLTRSLIDLYRAVASPEVRASLLRFSFDQVLFNVTELAIIKTPLSLPRLNPL